MDDVTFPSAPPITVESFVIEGRGTLPELTGYARRDARTFAEQTGTPLAVAEHGLRLQQIWTPTADLIRRTEADTYLAAGRDQAGTAAWISFTEPPSEAVRRRIEAMPVAVTVHVTHGLSEDQLQLTTGAAMDVLLASGRMRDGESGGDPITRAVVIHYNTAESGPDVDLERAARAAADAAVQLEVGPWLAFSHGTAAPGRVGV